MTAPTISDAETTPSRAVVVSDACSAFCPPGRKDCQITEDGVCDVRPCSAVLLAVHQICEDKWQAMVVVEHQTIGFGPLCDSEEECQWWCSQFKTAMSKAGARFISPNDERVHHYQRRRTSITGFGL